MHKQQLVWNMRQHCYSTLAWQPNKHNNKLIHALELLYYQQGKSFVTLLEV